MRTYIKNNRVKSIILNLKLAKLGDLKTVETMHIEIRGALKLLMNHLLFSSQL